MGRILMIGAGGVATVAAFKIAQNADVFTEFMIASRRKEKCDQIVDAIHKAGHTMDIKTAQVDADDEKRITVFAMQPMPCGNFRQEILGYSLMNALGIKGEEVSRCAN